MSAVALHRERPVAPEVVAMLRAQDAEYDALYPPELNFTIPLDALDHPDLPFFVARDATGKAMGCGGILFDGGFGELKRIYVRPEARGQRLAERIVARLEDEARARDCGIVRLETGWDSPAAMKLYARLGYAQIPAFAPYEENGSSVYMEKRLS